MQSDPQDDQWTLPDSRDGQPGNPDGAGAEASANARLEPPGGPAEAMPAGDRTTDSPGGPSAPVPAPSPEPPQMPAPPQMPGPRSGVRSWSSMPAPSQAPGPEMETVAAGGLAGPVEDHSSSGSPATTPEVAAEGSVTAHPPRVMAPIVEGGDWLATVCPYLTSEDGSYRSAEPDEGHRCIAVDPPATLPLAFQERFCLTDRHPRCEMYKYAQEVGRDGGVPVPATQLQAAATRPVRPNGRASGPRLDRRTAMAVGSVVGILLLALVLVFLMSSCGGGGAPAGSPGPGTTDSPATEATPTPVPQATPTPAPDDTTEPVPGASAGAEPDDGSSVTILYEVQEGEALLKVAETFGVTRKRLLRANPELEEMPPADLPGTVIEIPLPAEMTLEEAQAVPGYQGVASAS